MNLEFNYGFIIDKYSQEFMLVGTTTHHLLINNIRFYMWKPSNFFLIY